MMSVLGFYVYQKNYKPFSTLKVRIEQNGYIEDIELWNDSEVSYVFLPTYANLDSVFLVSDYKIYLDDKQLNVDDSLSDIELDKTYTLKEANFFNTDEKQIIFKKSANLPTIYIDTESGSLSALYEDKDYSEKATMRLFREDGTVEYNDDLDWISGRGNGTWTYDKRPWTIKTKNDVSLLGMEEDSKWVLFSNVGENSDGIRNMVAYSLAQEIGVSYACNLEFVDLYMNGVYFGTYQLGEKIEVSDNRMNIGDLTECNQKVNIEDYDLLANYSVIHQNEDGSFFDYTNINSPTDISGGYVVERNYGYKWENKTYRFQTTREEQFNVREPEALSEKEGEYLLSLFQSVENALYAEDFIDPVSGKEISELIDIDSWALKYLVDEVTKNHGGGSTSSYFFVKQGDSKVYAGPSWDYDKSIGESAIWRKSDGLTYCSWHQLDQTLWWKLLYNYKPFLEKVKEYYVDRVKPYCKELNQKELDEWADLISSSFDMNYIRWKDTYGFLDGDNSEALENADNLDYAIDYLKNWLLERESFLDSTWIDGEEYCTVLFERNAKSDGYVDTITVKYGKCLGSLPDYDYNEGNFVWVVEDNEEIIIDETTPITDDLWVKPYIVE